jgi:hypothetical protein
VVQCGVWSAFGAFRIHEAGPGYRSVRAAAPSIAGLAFTVRLQAGKPRFPRGAAAQRSTARSNKPLKLSAGRRVGIEPAAVQWQGRLPERRMGIQTGPFGGCRRIGGRRPAAT